METFKCKVPSWQDMHKLAKLTADKIKKQEYHPDVIIAIARGGLVPARLFCDFLHIKNCFSVKVDHWGLTATKDGKAKLTQGLNTALEGKRVLLVDDITDTGQSISVAKEHIEEFNPKEVKTATLIHLSNSKYTPDFFGDEMEWAWIIFPWNFREDMVNIIGKIKKDEHMAAEEIRKKLKLDHDVDADVEEIEEVLEHMDYLKKRG
ncbi:MAG: phosphoribosyltransferase [Candidatus Woesearchaeota archaeon]